MTLESVLSLLAFVVACAAAATPGIAFRPGAWYRRLAKPSWCPPDWLFGPVWTLLYLGIAIAGWLVWRAGDASRPLALWGAQLVLNALWSFLFFGLRLPGLALAEIALLLGIIVFTTTAFLRVSRAAGWLFVPYALWVAFAAYLNAGLWVLNR